ncbi:pyroglutamyl-peptidase I [Bacillus horti]|uniref:Pyrrolidone-carboxylate peptidase n=1 Tax=Caldalkalibacillus horti TaxID=77523 RepID=A0ABT9W3J9_9BACI|nr:pyroglutamyl-peptidase I [Bacillus horti]MDQ0167833.1 pyroglutamyl-peptidase [Bacillus horti]
MRKCLITGFEPFLDHPINPTEEIVKALNGQQLGEVQVIGKILPVSFKEAGQRIVTYIKELQPDIVVCLGLSAGRTSISPERVAINCMDGARDNDGTKWEDEKIAPTGLAAYFSTLPIRTMVNQLHEARLPGKISNTAGTYVCNHVMYSVLHHLSTQGLEHIPAGFIHVPASHELSFHQPKYPSISTVDLIKGIQICIEAI